jgi:hypothetical protein
MLFPSIERKVTFGCVALGLVVAIFLSPKDSFLLLNAIFFWSSQLVVLAVLLAFKPRPAVMAGVAIALAAYLAAFGAWLLTRVHPDSMAWLGLGICFLCLGPW